MNEINIQNLKDKIDSLNQQAWEVRVYDSPKAHELSRESVQLARSIHYEKGLAEGLRSLGFSYIRLFKNEEALPLLEESLSLFQLLNDPIGQGVVYEYLGIIQRNWGNLAASLELLLKGYKLILENNAPEVLSTTCYQIGVTYKHLGNYENALDYLFQSLRISKSIKFKLMEAYAIHIVGSIYLDNGQYDQALDCFQQGLVIRREAGDKWGEAGSLDSIGFTHLKLKNYDRAIEYCRKGLDITLETDDQKGRSNVLLHLAEIYKERGDVKEAMTFYNESLAIRKARGDKRGEAEVLLYLADLYANAEPANDLKTYECTEGALKLAEEIKAQDILSKAHNQLYEYYRKKGDFEKAFKHAEAHLQLEKEIHKNAISQKVMNLEISYKAEEARKEAEATQKRNEELTRLNSEISQQKKMLEKTLAELQATQKQLIQSEKMASLGELTAGIAHEIQNPLNFVNNFSEVNKELIDEMQAELKAGKIDDAITISNDIKENEEKINHHGKRADAIVKGMLQHSRASSGQKEPTDINALCDEYLRLAYHGLRAKDKSFNAKFETSLDESIGKINVVPQDIGRVILNLITNAFYVVNEKSKQNISGYEPAVTVKTSKIPSSATADKSGGGGAEIRVKDNGPGIPDSIKEKIFQPFFTTKPTGKGTGLGLSLSYDIIKAHSGEIKVETKEGEGSEFIIQLPVI